MRHTHSSTPYMLSLFSPESGLLQTYNSLRIFVVLADTILGLLAILEY